MRFCDRQASQYGSKLDWSHDESCQSLHKNPGPKPTLFVNKATIPNIMAICFKTATLQGNGGRIRYHSTIYLEKPRLFRDNIECINKKSDYPLVLNLISKLDELNFENVHWKSRGKFPYF